MLSQRVFLPIKIDGKEDCKEITWIFENHKVVDIFVQTTNGKDQYYSQVVDITCDITDSLLKTQLADNSVLFLSSDSIVLGDSSITNLKKKTIVTKSNGLKTKILKTTDLGYDIVFNIKTADNLFLNYNGVCIK